MSQMNNDNPYSASVDQEGLKKFWGVHQAPSWRLILATWVAPLVCWPGGIYGFWHCAMEDEPAWVSTVTLLLMFSPFILLARVCYCLTMTRGPLSVAMTGIWLLIGLIINMFVF
jgi:hypothetical protein